MNSKVVQIRLRVLASMRICIPNRRSTRSQSKIGFKGWEIAWTDGSSVIYSFLNISSWLDLATMKAKIFNCANFYGKEQNHLSIDNHASHHSKSEKLRIYRTPPRFLYQWMKKTMIKVHLDLERTGCHFLSCKMGHLIKEQPLNSSVLDQEDSITVVL